MSKLDEAQAIGSWRPHLLKGLLVEILQDFYSDSAHIWDDVISDYTWSADEKTTNLRITTRYHLDLDNPGIDAKIIVKTGQTKFNNALQNTGLADLNWDTGLWRQNVGSITQFTLTCVGTTEAFTEKLIDETAHMFVSHNKILRAKYSLKELNVLQYGPVKQQKDGVYGGSLSLTISVGHASQYNLNDLPEEEFGESVP